MNDVMLVCSDGVPTPEKTAARHPVSSFHRLELWPVVADHDGAVTRRPADWLSSGPTEGKRRFLMFLFDDGIERSRDAGAALATAGAEWADRARSAGVWPYAVALAAEHPRARSQRIEVRPFPGA